MDKTIPFFDTFVDPLAFSLVQKTLLSTFLSEGKLSQQFEVELERFGLSHPLTVNSGTSALHLALVLADIQRGDEVIIPAQTFIATALAVLYVGAKPVFADIDYLSGNIDPESIRKKITRKTKAILPVHWAGYPADLKAIHRIAAEHNLIVIEDAAHAFGATYHNKPIGSISRFTCFSFQAIKHLTTGDGGAVACTGIRDSKRGKKLKWFGIDRGSSKASLLGERKYILDEVGYKYHLNDFASALGIANLSHIKERLIRRKNIAKEYTRHLQFFSGIKLFSYDESRHSSYWIYGLHIQNRVNFIRAMKSRGISVSVVHQRIDKHPIFGGISHELENQAKFDKTQIHLPVYDRLTDQQVQYIIESIKRGW